MMIKPESDRINEMPYQASKDRKLGGMALGVIGRAFDWVGARYVNLFDKIVGISGIDDPGFIGSSALYPDAAHTTSSRNPLDGYKSAQGIAPEYPSE